MTQGIVFDVQRFCLHDGPGIRTVLFLKGCPLSCKWCCNPESQSPEPEIMFYRAKCLGCRTCESVCPYKALGFRDGRLEIDRDKCTACGQCTEVCPALALRLSGRYYTVDAIVAELLQDKAFFAVSGGGVTISGGEPLAQPEFVAEILQALKEHNIHTAIETSGYVKRELFDKVIDDTDLFFLDIKHLDVQTHMDATGVSNKLILENFKWLALHAKQLIVRCPLIPGLNTDSWHIEKLTFWVRKYGISDVEFLPYHRLGEQKYQALGCMIYEQYGLSETEL